MTLSRNRHPFDHNCITLTQALAQCYLNPIGLIEILSQSGTNNISKNSQSCHFDTKSLVKQNKLFYILQEMSYLM